MSKKDKEKIKWDLKKMEKTLELESKKNIRYFLVVAAIFAIALLFLKVYR